VDQALLADMAHLDLTEMNSAVIELLRRQILEETGARGRSDSSTTRSERSLESRIAPGKPSLPPTALSPRRWNPPSGARSYRSELGRHWDAAGEPSLARGHYLAAARAARDKYARQEAERLYGAYLKLVTLPSSRERHRTDRASLRRSLRPRSRDRSSQRAASGPRRGAKC
jgi:hypothetical protein